MNFTKVFRSERAGWRPMRRKECNHSMAAGWMIVITWSLADDRMYRSYIVFIADNGCTQGQICEKHLATVWRHSSRTIDASSWFNHPIACQMTTFCRSADENCSTMLTLCAAVVRWEVPYTSAEQVVPLYGAHLGSYFCRFEWMKMTEK